VQLIELKSANLPQICLSTHVHACWKYSSRPGLRPLQACIALTYPDRIHSFHLQHLAQPPADAAAALVGNSARAAAPPSDELQALLKSLALTADQRAVLICLRRM
jgi:hypothetical protein